jgi:hypothetical protein
MRHFQQRGSTWRTAAWVRISIGQTLAKVMTAISIRKPKPQASITSGISATDGMGRSTSMLRKPMPAARLRQPQHGAQQDADGAARASPAAALPSVKRWPATASRR